MKWHRIWAVVLRNMYLFKHNLDRQTDAFYWPTVDLVLWGVTSSYISNGAHDANFALLMVLSGIILWVAVWRGQAEFTVNILEDMWNKNLVNMFVSPLKLSEWAAGFVILGIGKAAVSVLFAAVMAFVLYHASIFSFGFQLLPFLFLLLMVGWWVGLFVGGLIIRYGSRVQNFAWSLVFVIAPFSAVYYPVSALPGWAQAIAKFLPTSYIFEASRQVLQGQGINWGMLLIALWMNIFMLVITGWFFNQSFKKVLRNGLIKLQS